MTPAEFKPTRSAADPASAGKTVAMTVRSDTATATFRPYSAGSMEILLLLWDEMDDWAGASRHLASSTLNELTSLSAPFVSAASALVVWILLPR
jgi:hypothetical protein